MPLTELQIKQAKHGEKTYSLSDGKGLLLEVRPNGKKYWIIRYWVGGKEHRTSVGSFPDVTLRSAREKNFEIRKRVYSGEGLHPEPSGNDPFSSIAAEWYEKRVRNRLAPSYARVIRLRLDRFILPAIGDIPFQSVTSAAILRVCREIEDSGTIETAHRVRQIIGQIFRYAIAVDLAENDPTVALHGALQSPKERHYATITDAHGISALMRHIDAYGGHLVRLALKFSALTFCRPGEIRAAEWSEIDLDSKEWRIPAEKMKMKRVHIVPLARQAIAVLEELKEMTGNRKWLFPSSRNDGRCMSENTIRVALRSMGFGNNDMTAHGFRGMASTVLNEHGFPVDVIERQLAHIERNAVRAAYNHAEYLPQRREMMQWWADHIEALREVRPAGGGMP